jgi:hypothetical protein
MEARADEEEVGEPKVEEGRRGEGGCQQTAGQAEPGGEVVEILSCSHRCSH